MSKRDSRRIGRLFGRDDETGDETVAMSGNDDHAWWADRRTLAGAPTSTQSGAPWSGDDDDEPAEAPTPEHDKWSAEALFADAGFDPIGPEAAAPQDDGVTTLTLTAGLDEARLVLGVTADADWATITKAHRALAMQFHPDRLGQLSLDAQELGQHRMAEINRAFDTLRDLQGP